MWGAWSPTEVTEVHLDFTGPSVTTYPWEACWPDPSISEAWSPPDAPLATTVMCFQLSYWLSSRFSPVWLPIIFLPDIAVHNTRCQQNLLLLYLHLQRYESKIHKQHILSCEWWVWHLQVPTKESLTASLGSKDLMPRQMQGRIVLLSPRAGAHCWEEWIRTSHSSVRLKRSAELAF